MFKVNPLVLVPSAKIYPTFSALVHPLISLLFPFDFDLIATLGVIVRGKLLPHIRGRQISRVVAWMDSRA